MANWHYCSTDPMCFAPLARAHGYREQLVSGEEWSDLARSRVAQRPRALSCVVCRGATCFARRSALEDGRPLVAPVLPVRVRHADLVKVRQQRADERVDRRAGLFSRGRRRAAGHRCFGVFFVLLVGYALRRRRGQAAVLFALWEFPDGSAVCHPPPRILGLWQLCPRQCSMIVPAAHVRRAAGDLRLVGVCVG